MSALAMDSTNGSILAATQTIIRCKWRSWNVFFSSVTSSVVLFAATKGLRFWLM